VYAVQVRTGILTGVVGGGDSDADGLTIVLSINSVVS
jgi:hypothetical protein